MAASLEELRLIHDRVCQCRRPEELFGVLNGTTKEEKTTALTRIFYALQRHCHPDHSGTNPVALHLATEASSQINLMRQLALKRIEEEIYGRPEKATKRTASLTIRTKIREYRIFEALAEGTISDVFLGEYDENDGSTTPICLKLVRDPNDNALMRQEQGILTRIKHKSLPVLI